MSGLKQAVRNTAKIIMFKGVYPLCYKVSSLRPLRKNKVIFAEIRSGTLTDSFRYIYEEIKTEDLIRRSITSIIIRAEWAIC